MRAPSVQLFLIQQQPSILVIIEPMIRDTTQIPTVPYYQPVYVPNPSNHSHGGLVIYFHTSITYQQHSTHPPRLDHANATTVAAFHIASPVLPRPFVFVPLYISCHTTSSDWHDMLSLFYSVPSLFSPGYDMPTLVMGDLNARHHTWDDNCAPGDYNATGNKLNSFISQYDDWHILNFMMPTLKPTYFPRDGIHYPSVIDLGISNDFNLVSMFHVIDHDILLSDHAPIMATLHTKPLPSIPRSPQRYIWNTSRADIPWDIFQAYLTPLLRTWRDRWNTYLSHTISFTQHDINTCWYELRQIIIDVALHVIGKKPVSPHHKHWFTINPAIPSLHRTYIRLCRRILKHKMRGYPVPPELHIQYRQAKQAFKQAMIDAKTQCWEELVQQVSHNHHVIWTAWHRTVPSTFHPLPTFTSTDPTAPPCTTPLDNLNIIGKHFQSISTLPDDPSFNKSMDESVKSTLDSLALPSQPVILPFTQQQLTDACEHINTNTALGPDDISPHFIKHGGPMLMSCLFLLFHLCYQHGVLPSQFTEGVVIALYKNKGDRHQPDNYRPINVSSIVIRLFERLMLPTLQQYMTSCGIPSFNQYGFTKARSTYDAIVRLLSFIGRYFNVPIPTVFIDISKAYDRVWVNGLLYKLHTVLHMSMHDLFFYRALLSHRTFRVMGNGCMSWLFVTPDGVPQGAVSAPYLFIIYIHDVVVFIQSVYIQINLFADDIVIWASWVLLDSHPGLVLFHMQQALNKLSIWASTWKITFSPTKTQMVIFYAAASLPLAWRSFSLTLSGFVIAIVDTYTYLGVILHRRLSWTPHIKELIRKSLKTSYHIARLAFYTTRSRPSLHVIRQLIHTVLLPKLAYGLPFITLYPDMDHPLMRQLKRLLIIPLRKSLGLPHNAHHDSIFIETRTLPVDYMQLYHSLLFARRHILQATLPQQQQQRYDQLFKHQPYFDIMLQSPSDPFYHIALRCRDMSCSLTSTLAKLQQASNEQLWNAVFNKFYRVWYSSQHPSTRNSPNDTHSLFTCYLSMRVIKDTSLPSYFRLLSPSNASVISRLRFNRSRLNQSLHYRRVLTTNKCPTCPDEIETVEHVVMSCPRYDVARFACFRSLFAITKLPPLSSSFPFPFLLCSFPSRLTNNQCNQCVRVISTFLSCVRRIRDM
jgi:Reverse transcriptase (RNA-dependent DNA polymerase)/Endonuclease-reverse transcriptase